ncbi:LacI family DNA-binding transcriptional regulator [Actinoplanes sp. M2I2]|uniref:LacI family DNA-binding transcriptional regulator n=1 Tax=Actinoplanes sp. M2I2 TaxID=1734444 RepID=UPI0020228822|nr:LacI family DNA-binding transcriptional regulator [Actinoplanes sp. M2I2]
MSSAVTIRDVARAAGVSVSTVSLALNAPDRVSEPTRRKVLRAADELGFVPKAEAVARARTGVGRIGVIGPFSSYVAASRRLNGVLRAARGAAVEVVAFDQESASTSPAPLLSSLPRTGRLDGLLISSLPLDDDVVRRLTDLDLPTVLIDVRHRGLSSVHTDDVAGGRIAAEHLLERGHRRFGYLGEAQRSDRYASPAQRRLDGFRQALADAGHPLSPDAVVWTTRDFAAARAQALNLLTDPAPPTAVFASDDLLAAAVRAAWQQVAAGGHGPGSLPGDGPAIVGFDGGDLAEALDLTTVDQPLEESGEVALQMLLERLARPGPARETTLDLALVARGSTARRG